MNHVPPIAAKWAPSNATQQTSNKFKIKILLKTWTSIDIGSISATNDERVPSEQHQHGADRVQRIVVRFARHWRSAWQHHCQHELKQTGNRFFIVVIHFFTQTFINNKQQNKKTINSICIIFFYCSCTSTGEYDDAAGKVERLKVGTSVATQPAKVVPDPVRDKIVHHERPEQREDDQRAIRELLGPHASNDSGREQCERHLVEQEERQRNRLRALVALGHVEAHEKRPLWRADEADVADRRTERDREAPHEPGQRAHDKHRQRVR